MGGDQNDPPLLNSIKMIQTWKKGMFWQKLIILAHFYAFGVQLLPFFTRNRTQNKPIFTCIEGSPLWIVRGKNCQLKFFWKFQKEIPKIAFLGPS